MISLMPSHLSLALLAIIAGTAAGFLAAYNLLSPEPTPREIIQRACDHAQTLRSYRLTHTSHAPPNIDQTAHVLVNGDDFQMNLAHRIDDALILDWEFVQLDDKMYSYPRSDTPIPALPTFPLDNDTVCPPLGFTTRLAQDFLDSVPADHFRSSTTYSRDRQLIEAVSDYWLDPSTAHIMRIETTEIVLYTQASSTAQSITSIYDIGQPNLITPPHTRP